MSASAVSLDSACTAVDCARAKRDLTELLERERERARKAEEASVTKDRLLEVATSESRAALNAVLGWTRSLMREHVDRAGRVIAYRAVESIVERHLALVEELLDLARGEHTRGQIDLTLVDVDAVVAAAVERAAVGADGVTVHCAPRTDAPHSIVADRERLRRAIGIVVDDVVGRAPSGSTVRASVEHVDATCRVRLTADKAPTSPRDELALALARNTVAVIGGKILLEGDATTPLQVTLALPMRRPDAAVRTLSGSAVLVAHDDEDIAELASALLRDRGATVFVARDPTVASIATIAHRPDMVVARDEDAATRIRSAWPNANVHVASTALDLPKVVAAMEAARG